MFNVLVIDDEKTITNALKRALTRIGHSVETADTGEEGVSLFDNNQFHYILLENLQKLSFVQFWPVGSSNDTPLSLTQSDISRFLLADWLPTLPVSISRSVMGWPQYLIEAETGSSTPYLFLSQVAGWSERQWKGVLSWMC